MKPSTARVLRMLQAHQPHAVPAPALEAIPCGSPRKAISDLRAAGFVILSQDLPGRAKKGYRLVREVAA